MSQKISAPTIKLTGIKDGENDLYIPLDQLGAINANGRRYDPVAVRNALNNLPVGRRYFSTLSSHPYSRKSILTQYLGLMSDNVAYRGTPVQRHPFMRKMSLMFKLALLHADLDRTTVMNARRAGKSLWEYRLFNERLHTFVQLQSELNQIEQQKPKPIDLTRYLKLLTGKDVWNPMPVWLKDVPPYFQPDDVMRAGVGKSLFYNMLPDIKLHLAGIHATLGGRPWIYDSNCMGPAGFWPATIEYGMAHNGPAITAQFNRERQAKPKKGKA